MPKCDRRGILERIEAKHGGVKNAVIYIYIYSFHVQEKPCQRVVSAVPAGGNDACA